MSKRAYRGTQFQGHMPVWWQGYWRQFHGVKVETRGRKLPINIENDVFARCLNETEQLQRESGWRCPECERAIANFQPWCGCGADIDWTDTGWTLQAVEIADVGDALAWIAPDGDRVACLVPHSGYSCEPCVTRP